MLIDLHCHSNASDGELAPQALLERAVAQGVTHLSLTDHDTVAGYRKLAVPGGLTLINGIELSTQWRKTGVHIVGLGIDLDHPALVAGIRRQREARHERAGRIAARLEKIGIADPLPAVQRIAGNASIGRPHFAQHLVDCGRVRTVREAFRKYLGTGKAGDVRDKWADLDEVVSWIRDSGGIAVLAHPAHYRLTQTKLRELLTDFRAAGGEAMEVVSGRQEAQVGRKLADMASDFGLFASQGSDFHRPGASWSELGLFSPMPAGCDPVWQRWI